VAGAGRIADVNIAIGSLNHTFDSDLTIDVVSPAGTTVRLFNRHGGSGDNLTSTVFDDQAATSITAGAAPFTGSFKPFEALSAFTGQDANGTWRLVVRDVASLDTGTLNSWSQVRQDYTCT
jgi:subtilisin-like proprotein convertase family protein